MKNVILIFSMLISLSSCNDDNTDKQENSIIGIWQLIHSIIGTGGDDIIHPIENGQTIIFYSKGTFEIVNGDGEFSCASGTYSIIEHSEENFTPDVISFNCNNGQNLSEYNYVIDKKKLFLTYLLGGEFPCDEICASVYTMLPSGVTQHTE